MRRRYLCRLRYQSMAVKIALEKVNDHVDVPPVSLVFAYYTSHAQYFSGVFLYPFGMIY